LVALIIAVGGGTLILTKFEPKDATSHQWAEILQRGNSSVISNTGARSEPLVLVRTSNGQARQFPSLYYAMKLDLTQACLEETVGRFTGGQFFNLVTPENCP
jgi:hypothetical protein